MGRPRVEMVAAVALLLWSGAGPTEVRAQAPPEAPGRVTIRAHRLPEALDFDGRIDEAIYTTFAPVTDFVQQLPDEGAVATERTEVWIFFDDDNVYVSMRAWDSQPARIVANELRRDNRNISQNDNFAVVFDTFNNGRNGFFFQTNPLGALRDQEFTNEGNPNADWNTVWDVNTSRFEQGWTLEMEIPFKSLRYNGSGPQQWGINLRRVVVWKDEVSYLSGVPAAYGRPGVFNISFAGAIVGLETPEQSMNLEVKPYAISALTTNLAAAEPFSDRWDSEAGFDVKYGLTGGLIADLTYNTDFAQVEADEQQINLTRFSLFFPEKREFFLEGRGIFAFGIPPGTAKPDVPVMFFSRRIGLSQRQSVPVDFGARVTGRAGPFSVGALNVQTDDAPSAGAVSTNFSVLRLRRDILNRSSVGVIATRRAPSTADRGTNTLVGVDASFLFLRYLGINGYYAGTQTRGAAGEDASYRAQVAYRGDRYGFDLDHVTVGDAFNPEVGFLRRQDFQRSSAQARFSPRPQSIQAIRRLVWEANFDYVTDSRRARVETREARALFRTEFESTDVWAVQYTRTYDYLPAEFEIAPGVVIPAGGYEFSNVQTGYGFGQQRRISGSLIALRGSFYRGDRTEVSSNGRFELTPRVSMEPALSVNWVDLPEGNFTTRLMSARMIFSPSARSVLSALLQYNSSRDSFSSNIRLRWEYAPGSEIFLVYSDGRNTLSSGFPEVENQTLAIKLTHLVRF